MRSFTITPFDCYCLYLGLKRHFNSDYDYIKYNGKVRASTSSFEKRADRSRFAVLAKYPDLQNLILANLVENSNVWVGDLLQPPAQEIYKQWSIRTQKLTYVLSEQLSKLDRNFDANFKVPPNEHPPLLKKLIRKDICPEMAVVLQNLLGYVSRWDKAMADDITWQQYRTMIVKYQPFVQCDKDKIKSAILKKFYVESS